MNVSENFNFELVINKPFISFKYYFNLKAHTYVFVYNIDIKNKLNDIKIKNYLKNIVYNNVLV